jgi:hypothetical protein
MCALFTLYIALSSTTISNHILGAIRYLYVRKLKFLMFASENLRIFRDGEDKKLPVIKNFEIDKQI